MKETPLLFTGAMVRAILEDRKTQTRRIVKLSPPARMAGVNPMNAPIPFKASHKIWVKETHAWADRLVDGVEREDPVIVAYRADSKILRRETDNVVDESDESWNLNHKCIKWRPSICMPRWASRITLEIVSVKVERVQDISEADALAEGVECEERKNCSGFRPPSNTSLEPEECQSCIDGYIPIYRRLWESINAKKPGCSWDENPWVFAIEFKRVNDAISQVFSF